MAHGGAPCSRAIDAPTASSCTASDRPASIAGRRAPAGAPAARWSRSSPLPPTQSARASVRAGVCKPQEGALPDPWIDKIRRASVYLANAEGHPLPRQARAARGRQPLPPAAQLQAARRRHAARVRGGVPAAEGEAAAAPGRGGDRRGARRRLRIEQPFLRARGAEAGHVAVNVSTRRSRHEHSVHDRRFAARAASGRRDAARRVRRRDGDVRRRAGRARWPANIRRRASVPTPGLARALDERDPRAPGRPPAAARSAARRAGDRVSVAGVGGAPGDSVRRDAHLRRDCGGDRTSARLSAPWPARARPIRSRSRSRVIASWRRAAD